MTSSVLAALALGASLLVACAPDDLAEVGDELADEIAGRRIELQVDDVLDWRAPGAHAAPRSVTVTKQTSQAVVARGDGVRVALAPHGVVRLRLDESHLATTFGWVLLAGPEGARDLVRCPADGGVLFDAALTINGASKTLTSGERSFHFEECHLSFVTEVIAVGIPFETKYGTGLEDDYAYRAGAEHLVAGDPADRREVSLFSHMVDPPGDNLDVRALHRVNTYSPTIELASGAYALDVADSNPLASTLGGPMFRVDLDDGAVQVTLDGDAEFLFVAPSDSPRLAAATSVSLLSCATPTHWVQETFVDVLVDPSDRTLTAVGATPRCATPYDTCDARPPDPARYPLGSCKVPEGARELGLIAVDAAGWRNPPGTYDYALDVTRL
jgi:hypothetical protein